MRKIVVLLAFCLGACFHNTSPAMPEPATTLKVENQAFLDMTIYLLRGPERRRLGIAHGSSTSVFTIPADVLHGPTPLQFLADPIGGSRLPITEEVTVTAGDEVTMMIPPR